MEELKVNEFVRTKEGYIARVKEVDNKAQAYWFDNCILKISGICCYDLHFEATNYIVKHSFDIKDLVQAGDIILYNVNSKMTDIEIVKEHIDARTQEKTLRVGLWSLEQVEIKEILTKEQFDSRKYIVGDESNVCN